jgi:hypothetical protein
MISQLLFVAYYSGAGTSEIRAGAYVGARIQCRQFVSLPYVIRAPLQER